MAGRTYAENRPYLLPETLAELAGPVTGVIWLPLRLDWSARTEFHLNDPAERNVMYERVIREATRIDDLRSYLNEESPPSLDAAIPARSRAAKLGSSFP